MLQSLRRCITNFRFFTDTIQNGIREYSFCLNNSPLCSPYRETISASMEDCPDVIPITDIQKGTGCSSTIADLLQEITQMKYCPISYEVKQRLAKFISYSISYGRQYEGRGVVDTYKLIQSPEKLTPENIKLAYVLTLCVSMHVATLVQQDDIIDGDVSRRNRPCWHTLPNIGITALNDCTLLQGMVYDILKRYFSSHRYYGTIIELFHAATYGITLGQTIDMTCTINKIPRFEVFTRKRSMYLAKYKSASYCSEFPLRLALYLAEISDAEIHKHVSYVSFKIGSLIMIHNDYQDVLGRYVVLGKGSTDIRNGRASWLAVEALERATPAQKQIFMEHYGNSSFESEQIIYRLYKELQLPKVYEEIKEQTINEIYEDIKSITHCIPKEVFANLLTDITLYR